jgi:hypothetical protein
MSASEPLQHGRRAQAFGPEDLVRGPEGLLDDAAKEQEASATHDAPGSPGLDRLGKVWSAVRFLHPTGIDTAFAETFTGTGAGFFSGTGVRRGSTR